ncbi:phosphopantetheine-binding protein [Pseudomonas orientalis]|uniref:Carrier domain-containing protein n=1 Tax=Pseudomonas orientalis TaxID=76758 RepID=A0A2L0RYY4_9PSED|nr:phosphopantetheine-binding protein [Pseudomonas orientalis]AUZ47313.1 hypothetical protein BOP93_17525 [Pseudomonas orientalis]
MSDENIAALGLEALLFHLFPNLAQQIDAHLPLHDQGISSMGMILLITHLQDEFHIVFDYDMLADLHKLTFAALHDLCAGQR